MFADSSLKDRKNGIVKLAVLGALVLSLSVFIMSSQRSNNTAVNPTRQRFLLEGLKYCKTKDQTPKMLNTNERRTNPRFELFSSGLSNPPSYTIIKNGMIIDGDGTTSEQKMDIYIRDGVVHFVMESSSAPSTQLENFLKAKNHVLEVIDANNHYITPGLVEMHSHIGICSQPELKGNNDMFETMSPVTPFTRTIDAFNIGDPAIQLALNSGVTSALILPSANLISGEGYVFKMMVPPSKSVEEMLVQYESLEDTGLKQRWMKMACGENPKRRYKTRPEAPKSRMGLGHLFRHTLDRAKALKNAQDVWCDSVLLDNEIPTTAYPLDDELNMLVDLMRGKVLSNAHCYETYDIETLLRHAREYQIEINALHHSLDAYLIPDIIKEQPYNITLATFASQWGFKKEAFQASVFAPKILEKNNLSVVLTTDHPALPQQSLLSQAQVAHHYGLSAEKAIASITGEAAKGLRLDDRIGYLRKGYDADIVIWSDHPLQMGAKPLKVFIDGVPAVDSPIEQKSDLALAPKSVPEFTGQEISKRKFENQSTILFTGVTTSYDASIEKLQNTDPWELLIENGTITCFQLSCTEFYSSNIENIPRIHVEDGHILPLVTTLTPSHGLNEMNLESSTGDGILMEAMADGQIGDFRDPQNIPIANDGLQFGSMHLIRAFATGIGNIITPPARGEGQLFMTGVSTAFRSNSEDFSSVLKEEVALHVTVGDMGKQVFVPTISSQISTLRSLLVKNREENNLYGRVARKQLPLAVHTNSKDVMLHLLRLKQELDIYIIIVGGVESHLLATKLAANNVPVVVSPWQCQRKFWDERRCLTGLAGQGTLLASLIKAGVKTGLSSDDDTKVRLLLHDSGLAASLAGISKNEVIKMITTNMEEIFNLTIPKSPSFFVSEGFPLGYGSRIAALIDRGIVSKVYPELEPAIDIYS